MCSTQATCFSGAPTKKTLEPACKPSAVSHTHFARGLCFRLPISTGQSAPACNRKALGKMGAGGGHVSGPTVARRLALRQRPTQASSVPGRHWALFGLAGGGVYPAKSVTRSAVRSYRTISTLPVPRIQFAKDCSCRQASSNQILTATNESKAKWMRSHRRCIFCGTFPRITPGGH